VNELYRRQIKRVTLHLTFARRRRFLLLVACGAIGATLLQLQAMAQEPKADQLTAKQIVERSAEQYAKCGSYHDAGVVRTVFFWTDSKRSYEKPFKTAFVRPDRFRFEFKDWTHPATGKQRPYIVWCKGDDVLIWWDISPEVKKPESLESALEAAAAVSSGSAHTIPALLIPDQVGGRRLADFTDAKRIEDAKLGKVDCFRIQGKFSGGSRTMWVDKEMFLVRRIDAQNGSGDFRAEETTTYQPVINGEIADKLLQFDPPRRD